MPAGALTRNRALPRSALAIGAHPDDVEFGAGGTLAKWATAGCVVHHLVLTDGSKGTWDASADTVALVTRRRDEQRAAAKALGATGEVVFLAHADGELTSDLARRAEVCRVLREVRPEVVLGHDPWKRYRLHPDHHHAGLLACEGIVASRDPHFFPEQDLAPHRPEALLLWEADEPDHAEDVSGFVGAKLAALEAHASQFESTMKATDELQLEAFRKRVRERLATHGRRIGVAAAELFRIVPDL
jgi:LmbE family N-acetylglucosaminyl deacetylase